MFLKFDNFLKTFLEIFFFNCYSYRVIPWKFQLILISLINCKRLACILKYRFKTSENEYQKSYEKLTSVLRGIQAAVTSTNVSSIMSLKTHFKKLYRFGGVKLLCFLKMFRFLERIRTEHTDIKDSLDSKLRFCSIYSIRIRSRK